MNRRLQFINFFGVLVLVVLCVAQWRANRRLNLHINRLEKIRIEQSGALEEQSKKIKGYVEDLDNFRNDLAQAKNQVNEQTQKADSTEALARRVSDERDQLKTSVSNWAKAVADRDARLKENNETIRKLSEEANAAVKKFNELATNYNTVVKELNAARSQDGKKEAAEKP